MNNKKKIEDIIKFEPEFFEGETRADFYIQPLMKNAWAANMEILHQVDLICKENGIRYFVDWGTLLGTVREKGFIPWDDDVDICMLRDDLKKFKVVVKDYEDLKILDFYEDPNWGPHATKLVNTTNFEVSRQFIKKFHGFPFTASVDIFVVDYAPREEEKKLEIIKALSLSSQARHLIKEMEEIRESSKVYRDYQKELKTLIKEIEVFCHMKFSSDQPSEQELLIFEDEVSGLYTKEDADYVTQWPCIMGGKDYYFPKEAFESEIRMPFESLQVPVHLAYKEKLIASYGESYMTPRNTSAGHDYPFFATLIKALTPNGRKKEIKEKENFINRMAVEYHKDYVNNIIDPAYNDEVVEQICDIYGVEDFNAVKIAAKLEILEEIKRLCDLNHICYFAYGPTLEKIVDIGVLDYSDDNIYLSMKRDDYIVFMNNIQEQLSSWFDYRSVYVDGNHHDLRTYVYTDKYLRTEEDYKKRFHGYESEVGVFISVIDGVDKNIEREKTRNTLIKGLINTGNAVGTEPPYSQEEIAIVGEWKKSVGIEIESLSDMRRSFYKSADALCAACRDDYQEVKINSELQAGEDKKYLKKYFESSMPIDIKITKINVPIGYKELVD